MIHEKFCSVLASVFLLGATAGPVSAQTAKEIEVAQNDIWAKEQSIYEGRSRGDISNYRDNIAPGYLSWPPQMPGPIDAGRFSTKVVPSQEKLAMEFRGFAMNGDTAVIYYSTHMTQNAAGNAVDLRYQVTHTWIRRDGKWAVFAGMARPVPKP